MKKKLQNLTKATAIVIVTMSLVASCSSGDENPQLEALKTKRDSLKTAQSELNEQIAEVESEIAKPLKLVQENNKEVDIGSYPFFRKGKIGVSIVLRSRNKSKINICSSQILIFVKEKNLQIVERE